MILWSTFSPRLTLKFQNQQLPVLLFNSRSWKKKKKKQRQNMSVLGDDGLGYDLARKLETLGMWRAWLGDSLYSNFLHSLSSPASWQSFMRTDDSKSKSHFQLQLRARALLFDKASVSLFLRSNTVAAVSNLNPNCQSRILTPFSFLLKIFGEWAALVWLIFVLFFIDLQLHGDDVYFTLEDEDQRREGGGVGATTKVCFVS